jgi:hypothetical protein
MLFSPYLRHEYGSGASRRAAPSHSTLRPRSLFSFVPGAVVDMTSEDARKSEDATGVCVSENA